MIGIGPSTSLPLREDDNVTAKSYSKVTRKGDFYSFKNNIEIIDCVRKFEAFDWIQSINLRL